MGDIFKEFKKKIQNFSGHEQKEKYFLDNQTLDYFWHFAHFKNESEIKKEKEEIRRKKERKKEKEREKERKRRKGK